jgi:hypothetical protein
MSQLDMFNRRRPPQKPAQEPSLAPEDARDAVLAQHAEERAELIEVADQIAAELSARDGAVCMPRILAALRARGYGAKLDVLDPRWTGAVLLPTRGWERTGEIAREGSRARPVPMWRRKS